MARTGGEPEERPGASAPSAAGQTLVIFEVAEQPYAVPLAAVQEITPLARLSRPPGVVGILAGFLNVGGQAVAVIRLNRLLGMPDRPAQLYTPLLLLRDSAPPVALLVDKVQGVVSVLEESILPLPRDHSFNGCAIGVAQPNGHAVLVLSPERILLEKERQHLAELTGLEQQRLGELEELEGASP